MDKAKLKQQRAFALARARGAAAKEFFKSKKLTKETQPEFDAIMKEVTKRFKKGNPV